MLGLCSESFGDFLLLQHFDSKLPGRDAKISIRAISRLPELSVFVHVLFLHPIFLCSLHNIIEKIYRRYGCNGSNCTPLYKILRRKHKKMGCRNKTCTNTDSSGSLDMALMDILASLLGSLRVEVLKKEEIAEKFTAKTQHISSMYLIILSILYIYIYVCVCVRSFFVVLHQLLHIL